MKIELVVPRNDREGWEAIVEVPHPLGVADESGSGRGVVRGVGRSEKRALKSLYRNIGREVILLMAKTGSEPLALPSALHEEFWKTLRELTAACGGDPLTQSPERDAAAARINELLASGGR